MRWFVGVLLAYDWWQKNIQQSTENCMFEDGQYKHVLWETTWQTTATACMERNVTDGNRCPNMAVWTRWTDHLK